MEAIRIDEGAAIRVMWKDSSTRKGWKFDLAPAPGKIISLGYCTGATGEGLQISTSVNEEFSYIDPLDIPWGAIEDVTLLGEEWNRNA